MERFKNLILLLQNKGRKLQRTFIHGIQDIARSNSNNSYNKHLDKEVPIIKFEYKRNYIGLATVFVLEYKGKYVVATPSCQSDSANIWDYLNRLWRLWLTRSYQERESINIWGYTSPQVFETAINEWLTRGENTTLPRIEQIKDRIERADITDLLWKPWRERERQEPWRPDEIIFK